MWDTAKTMLGYLNSKKKMSQIKNVSCQLEKED